MTLSRTTIRGLRTTPFARAVVARWRTLAPMDDGPTLVACSGGADSLALLLALASAEPESIRVAHVLHDMRPREDTFRDAEHVRSIAQALSLPFVQREVTGADTEARARRLRYDALGDLARDHGCPFVATGHHADDQLETFIMRAIRGASPAGLRGIAEQRRLTPGVRLVRPMLTVTHDDCAACCEQAGVAWREDPTNTDTSRTRAALRARVLPALRTIRPDAAKRVSDAARLQRDAYQLVRQQSEMFRRDDRCWTRDELRSTRNVVIAQRLREDAITLGAPPDRLTQRHLTPVLRAIRDSVTDPRTFEWGGGVRVRVTAHEVSLFRDAR
ncbi:MAG: hypothetical protein Tsb0013_04720 [Phycisphaerales bacterium]